MVEHMNVNKIPNKQDAVLFIFNFPFLAFYYRG
jgi:hypothetical protein